MKTPWHGLVFAFFVGVVSAQDARAPQPRARLDPVTRATVTSTAAEMKSTATEVKSDSPAPAVMMDRFVVKGIAALPFVQRKEPVLQGKFTPLRGGSFVEHDFGKKRLFIGVKPWLDMMEDDARFKHPAAPRINFTLLELGF